MKIYTKNRRIRRDAIPPQRLTVSDSPLILKVGKAPNMSKLVKNFLIINLFNQRLIKLSDIIHKKSYSFKQLKFKEIILLTVTKKNHHFWIYDCWSCISFNRFKIFKGIFLCNSSLFFLSSYVYSWYRSKSTPSSSAWRYLSSSSSSKSLKCFFFRTSTP